MTAAMYVALFPAANARSSPLRFLYACISVGLSVGPCVCRMRYAKVDVLVEVRSRFDDIQYFKSELKVSF